ncbi:MAG TPA: chitobiase/beta-hexosaminidase C-terminal domain-containing protein [Opitutaceae bacterium]|jgi:hypothetical protein|nr:chitobiase/beta-hexosaminidase C-terminal domain-containing protein [Opitutaceae bacterium]
MKTVSSPHLSIRSAIVSAFLCLLSFGLAGSLSAQTFEAENLSPVGTGATVSTSSTTDASGGVVEFLNSTAVGQIMTFTTPSIPAGTYQFQLRYWAAATHAQHTVKIDGTQIGGTTDQYAATAVFLTTTLGNVTFSTAGTHSIAMTVTGKNASATKFLLTADSFTFTSQTPQAAAPVFSPAGGTYTTTQTVTISTTTGGASIRYTTDGSTPSETAGTIYSGPVSISATTTLKAIAYESGFTDSAVATASYTINTGGGGTTVSFEAENLSYTGSGATTSVQTDTNSSGGKWVELAGNSTGDSITFTTSSITAGTYSVQMEWKGNNSRGILQLSVDGTNLGSTLDQYASGQTYPTTTFGTVTFSSAGTHTVKLTVTGKNSASSSYQLSADKFTFTATGGTGGGTVSAPVFSPAAGTYTSAQTVTITSATAGSSIHYTTDGSTPSETAGTFYSGAVNISASTTFKAIAYKSGSTDSSITSAAYTINIPPAQVAAPTFSPAAGTYTAAQTVTINSATAGATIHYTTDGSTPSETAGTIYSGPVSISATATLQAIASKSGMTDSSVTSGAYVINTGGGTVTFQNNGTKEGWPNYPQTPEAKGTITDVTTPTYHSTSAIEFTQTFQNNYTGRYHSEVDIEGAQQTNQDRYYGMTFFLPAGWQYATDQVNVQQWAGTGPWIIFRIDGPDIIILFDHLPDGFFDEPHIFQNVPNGVWVRVVTHIRSSTSGGIWECWINGNHVYSHTGNLDAPGNGGAIRWSTGCYVSGWYQKSSPQGPSFRLVYGTHYRVATTYDLAEPANW